MPKECSIDRLHELFYVEEGRLIRKIKVSSRGMPGQEAKSLNNKGYLRVNIDKESFLVHRVIWAMKNNRWPLEEIDHINGDTLDNRVENLREATHLQNMRNSKGAGVHRYGNKWKAQISVHSKTVYCGTYEDKELAELVISEARRKYFGEFRRNV